MSKTDELFKQPLCVINMGLKSFADDLKSQNVRIVHLDWRPPASGNTRMMSLLGRLKNKT